MLYVILAYITYPIVLILRGLRAGGSPPSRPSPPSFLVFQTAKVGDMICTTPVFREIKRAYPKARVGVVINPVTAPILRHNPHVDEVIEFDRGMQKGLFNKLRFALLLSRKGYSSALILMPNSANILSAFWALIPERVSVYPDYAGLTLKLLLSLNTGTVRHERPRMSLETYLEALRRFGITGCKWDKEVYSTPEAERKASEFLKGEGPFIGIVPGTANVMKEWGRDNFLKFTEMMLCSTASTVVMLGPQKDRGFAGDLLRDPGLGGRILDACGVFSLLEAPSLIRRLSLVVGVDTGLIYMADALNVPVVDIAGPCDMDDQRPIGQRAVIIQKKGLDCVPCSHTHKTPYECRVAHRRCVLDVAPEEVFGAALRSLGRGYGRAEQKR